MKVTMPATTTQSSANGLQHIPSHMDKTDNILLIFSNYGLELIFVLQALQLTLWKNGGMNTGTSMASPHVCGLLLLERLI
jgi:hypothetical protein